MEFGDYKLNEMWQEFLFMANLMSYEINNFTIHSERIHTTMKELVLLKPNIIIKISIILKDKNIKEIDILCDSSKKFIKKSSLNVEQFKEELTKIMECL